MDFDIAAWRQQRAQTLTLSCGLTVTLRKVGLLDLAARGQIPTPLADRVLAFLESGDSAIRHIDLVGFERVASVINLICLAAIVAPLVAEQANDDHIGIDEIPMLDRLEIFNWAQQEGAQLIAFPTQPDTGAPAASDQPTVSSASVGNIGDRG